MKEYIDSALRTESLDHFKVDSPRLLHAAIGINTEIGELLLSADDVNRVEEVGDCLWYLAVLANELEASFDELELLGRTLVSEKDLDITDAKTLFEHGINMLDLVKRGLFYGVTLDEIGLARNAGVVLICLRNGIESEGYPLEEAMVANIAKLARRYPDKFTTEAAVDRDLEAELEVLKSQIN